MKKIFLLFLVSPVILYAQLYDHKIKVEIDNSTKYRYEEAYYRASIDQSNKEIADGIKGYADKYFTALRRNADYVNEQKLNSPEVEAEFKRLRYYGEEILNLIPQMNSNEFTGNKMVNTIEKAFEELSYSNSKHGKLYKLMMKNKPTSELNSMTDRELEKLIISKTSETEETLNAYCAKQNQSSSNYTTYKNCLINLLAEIKNRN